MTRKPGSPYGKVKQTLSQRARGDSDLTRESAEIMDRRLASRMGRPLMDPADLRSERFGFRLHPDLFAEASRLSRLEGLRLSIFCERALIAYVNQKVGSDILDAIGRYKVPEKPTKR